jgi:hypothetical protein
MSEQAQELSRRAADLASHARQVQKAHLAAMRAGAARAEQVAAAASPAREPAPAGTGAITGSARDHAGFAKKVQEAHMAAMRAGAERSKQAERVKNQEQSAPERVSHAGNASPARLAQDLAGFARRVSTAHDAAMRAGAERSRQAERVKNQEQPAPEQASPAGNAPPARPARDLASFAWRVNAAHDAAMRAGAARAQKSSAANDANTHSVSESKEDPQGQPSSDPAPASQNRPVSMPPMAAQLSRRAADLARHATQVQSEHLVQERARQARAFADTPPNLDVPALSDSEKGKKSRKKRKKELKKALKRLKKEIEKLKRAGN